MKYLICEGKPNGEYNAASKARADANHILLSNGYVPLYVESVEGIQEKKYLKYKQFFSYRNNLKKWLSTLENLEPGDIVFIQYPLIHITSDFYKYLFECQKKSIYTIALIHDLESIRFEPKVHGWFPYKRVNKDDRKNLPLFNKVISHNEKMTEKLLEYNLKKQNIVNLGVFDYLHDYMNKKDCSFTKEVIIAGNLSPYKTKYLNSLNEVKGITFNLYGAGFNQDINYENVVYKGSFLPDELIPNLIGSFGLVWDGDTICTCSGCFGKYLRFNNPHKLSLYLSAAIPVIVWRQSAVAMWVENYNLGISVDDLRDLNRILSTISDDDYKRMQQNCLKISRELKQGSYLKNAIEKCEE